MPPFKIFMVIRLKHVLTLDKTSWYGFGSALLNFTSVPG